MISKKRNEREFIIEDISTFKLKAWVWSHDFEVAAILENNNIKYPHQPFDNILAAGAKKIFSEISKNPFEELKRFHRKNNDWLFGYFSYDLKNHVEDLHSQNPDFQNAPEIFFFIPEHLIRFKKGKVIIQSFHDPQKVFEEIQNTLILSLNTESSAINLKGNTDQETYIKTVNSIKGHLESGDIYELNYCIEFTAEDATINPLSTFLNLIENSPMPFSFFLKAKDQYIICASPERFIKKEASKLISQPIKGTIKRGTDHKEDELLKTQLKTSEKEQSENIMIVDLVRNDLARSSKAGSVEVEELFGIYTFKQLHQMISTVTSTLRDDIHYIDAIKNAFPMGSMTGAPKIRAMELIEKYELAKRGMFSGAGGYFTSEENFDFNVLIRSIFYNSAKKTLSFQVGSAITFEADPATEYEECMLKAKAMFEVLGKT